MLLVNTLSTVIRMPHWFPGASFKREGSKMLPHVTAAIDEPYAVVQAALVRFAILISWQARHIHCLWFRRTGQLRIPSPRV